MNVPFWQFMMIGGFALFMAGSMIGSRMRDYLRKQYPIIWSGFGFSSRGIKLIEYSEADETRDYIASMKLRLFMRSQARRNLHDARLNRLYVAYWTCMIVGACMGAAAIVRLVVRFAL